MNLIVGRDKSNKRKDVYVVNGSDASTKRSSHKSAISSKSENYDPIPRAKVKQMQLIRQRPNSNQSDDNNVSSSSVVKRDVVEKESTSKYPTKNGRRKERGFQDSWSNSEFEKMFEAVDVDEIRRQKNARALRRHLKEISSDWDNEVNDLNTLRRNKVMKELHNYLKNTIDLVLLFFNIIIFDKTLKLTIKDSIEGKLKLINNIKTMKQ